MKNKQLIRKIALGMQTKAERDGSGMYGSPFHSIAWNNRRKAIQDRVKKQTARVKIRKMEREKALKDGIPVVYSIK